MNYFFLMMLWILFKLVLINVLGFLVSLFIIYVMIIFIINLGIILYKLNILLICVNGLIYVI